MLLSGFVYTGFEKGNQFVRLSCISVLHSGLRNHSYIWFQHFLDNRHTDVSKDVGLTRLSSLTSKEMKWFLHLFLTNDVSESRTI
jgi:hypothetical protein